MQAFYMSQLKLGCVELKVGIDHFVLKFFALDL